MFRMPMHVLVCERKWYDFIWYMSRVEVKFAQDMGSQDNTNVNLTNKMVSTMVLSLSTMCWANKIYFLYSYLHSNTGSKVSLLCIFIFYRFFFSFFGLSSTFFFVLYTLFLQSVPSFVCLFLHLVRCSVFFFFWFVISFSFI